METKVENEKIKEEGIDKVAKLLEYLEEKEKTIRRCSDKLRRAVNTVAQQFGPADECRVCGRDHKNEARAAVDHRFEAKIDVPSGDDLTPFAERWIGPDEAQRLYLCFRGGRLMVLARESCGYEEYWDLGQIPRDALKELVRSGRLIAFLESVADTLEKEGKEYEAAAEVASRLAEAAKPSPSL